MHAYTETVNNRHVVCVKCVERVCMQPDSDFTTSSRSHVSDSVLKSSKHRTSCADYPYQARMQAWLGCQHVQSITQGFHVIGYVTGKPEHHTAAHGHTSQPRLGCDCHDMCGCDCHDFCRRAKLYQPVKGQGRGASATGALIALCQASTAGSCQAILVKFGHRSMAHVPAACKCPTWRPDQMKLMR